MTVNLGGCIRERAGPAHVHAAGILRIGLLYAEIFLVELEYKLVPRARNLLHKYKLFTKPAVVRVFLNFRERLRRPTPAIGYAGGSGNVVSILFQEHRPIAGQSVDSRVVNDS